MRKTYSIVFGVLSLLGIFYASLLYFWNIVDPVQGESRVKLHCSVSKLTLITVASYIYLNPFAGLGDDWFIQIGVGMYLIVIASGVALLYLPNSGVIRYHARAIHPAFVVGLMIVILYHLLMLFDTPKLNTLSLFP